MRKAQVLLSHPNREIQELVRHVVENTVSSDVHCAIDGAQALDIAHSVLPDLIIIGQNLSEIDGCELCARLRMLAPFSEVPILMIMDSDNRNDRYRSYRSGVDEIIDLPFDQVELELRLKVHFRRRRIIPAAVRGPGITLDPRLLTAWQDNRRVELTPSEYAILSLLVQRCGTLVPVDSILVEALGSAPRVGNPQVVHTHIRNIRRKIESDPTFPQRLQSCRSGYWWGDSIHTL